MMFRMLLSLIFSLIFSVNAFASCDHLFFKNREIQIENTTLLCNSFYAVKYDVSKNAPILTSELLQPLRLQARKNIKSRTDR